MRKPSSTPTLDSPKARAAPKSPGRPKRDDPSGTMTPPNAARNTATNAAGRDMIPNEGPGVGDDETDPWLDDELVQRILAISPRGRPVWGKYTLSSEERFSAPGWWGLLSEADFRVGQALRIQATQQAGSEWTVTLQERTERVAIWIAAVEALPGFGAALGEHPAWLRMLKEGQLPLLGDAGAEAWQSGLAVNRPHSFVPPAGFDALRAEGKAALAALQAHLEAPWETARTSAEATPADSARVNGVSAALGVDVVSSLAPVAPVAPAAPAAPADDFTLSSDEAAKALGLSRARVHALAQSGRLESRELHRDGRKLRLFSASGVAAWTKGRAGS